MELVTASLQMKVCNLDYLENFSGGDKSFIRQMVELFLKQVPDELGNIRIAAERRDLLEVKQVAHKLKSSVSLLGADAMATRLKQIEDLAQHTADSEKVLTVHNELTHLYLDAELELKGVLETL